MISVSNTLTKVRRVYCVGRNYAEHRAEMGGSERDEPFFFQKPHDSVIQSSHVSYPTGTREFSYEAELVVLMGDQLNIKGYTVGVDFTKRDLQREAKKNAKPWEIGKSFDNSALVGQFSSQIKKDDTLKFFQNGILRQSAPLSDMIWSVDKLILKLIEQDFSVKAGDLIFTGTPAGVGNLVLGDSCMVQLVDQDGNSSVPDLKFTVK